MRREIETESGKGELFYTNISVDNMPLKYTDQWGNYLSLSLCPSFTY
jgi:hypothetical protein